MNASSSPIQTDVLIIGAGPVGLFAAFEAGVLGLSCHIVDALGRIGGQCIELYPDKPIYDIPAIPSCTARELVDRLLTQIRPFDVPIHLDQRVQAVEQREDHRWTVRTEQGMTFDVAAILIAAGNGAFVPQRLQVPEAAALEGRDVLYSVARIADFQDREVVIAGGGDSALDWANALAGVARNLTLVHRRNGFSAAAASVAAMKAKVEAGEMRFVVGMIDSLDASDGALRGVRIKHVEGTTDIAAEKLIVLYGLVADLGPIAGWNLDVRGGRIEVDTSNYESSRPGIFAVGDIANYPNKQKLILSGFHEASLALRKAYAYAYPDKKRTHIHSSYDAKLAERVQASTTDASHPAG
ncbi:NAD(P)/FAD-dependent oxidoreductase [Caballeronia sp. LZ062]|uniref:NAD(P)/FAD-dependent oxidoreductase n=1 Tax=unclassified Caballeronia TaxID=2646786 RepID=UPI00285D0F42|nr:MULTISPECIES: NAD(P)/FAD-dependent oxidoreductase [unclassified Caballeronia]MDR5857484.1 NAD(P)/FAD-dependent oxidoreductase [Caballeronia sp. LZ050]MDR5869034.1 NAD(P)/FAD-dependent oxidoreductase [Caballeronia sp. LZ062]